MDLLDRLLGHDKATTDELLARSAELSPEQWDQEFDISWKSVHATFGLLNSTPHSRGALSREEMAELLLRMGSAALLARGSASSAS